MTKTNLSNSGEGTRPTTSGGVENLGAGERFVPQDGPGEKTAPAPHERMDDKRKDVASTRADDSAPYHLRQDHSQEPNTDPSAGNQSTPKH